MHTRVSLPQDSTPLDLPPDAIDLALPDVDTTPSSPSEPSDSPAGTPTPAEGDKPAESPSEPSTPPPQTIEPKVTEEALLRSFNQIAKREREQREREQALKEREEKLRGLEPLAEALEKRDAWALLERMGYTYEDLTRDYISGNGPDPNRQVRDEIAQTKKQLEAQLAELRAEAERRRLEEERQYLRQTIDNHPDFPLTKALGAHDLVAQAVQAHYQEHGDLISYEDAAARVEQNLVDLADRLFQIDSIRNKYVGAARPEESRRDTDREVPVTTLRNEDTQDRTNLVPDTFDPLTASDEEMIERLASQLRYVS